MNGKSVKVLSLYVGAFLFILFLYAAYKCKRRESYNIFNSVLICNKCAKLFLSDKQGILVVVTQLNFCLLCLKMKIKSYRLLLRFFFLIFANIYIYGKYVFLFTKYRIHNSDTNILWKRNVVCQSIKLLQCFFFRFIWFCIKTRNLS